MFKYIRVYMKKLKINFDGFGKPWPEWFKKYLTSKAFCSKY